MAKEFSDLIQPRLGIAPSSSFRTAESGYLARCVNAVPSETGLSAVETFYRPFNMTFDWPYPALMQEHTSKRLLMTRTRLHTIDNAWNAVEQWTWNAASQNELAPIISGSYWTGFLYEQGFFLTNGESLVWQTPASEKILVQSAKKISKVGRHGDRLIAAGFSGSYFNSARWAEYVALWKACTKNVTFQNMAPNVLWVSSLAYDYAYYLFVAMLEAESSSVTDIVHANILSAIENKLIGFAYVPGTVNAVQEIGTRLVVYTDQGMFSLTTDDSGEYRASMIASGSFKHACGDLDHHYAVDSKFGLWKYSMNGELTYLNFKNQLSQLVMPNIRIMMDSHEREWYICDGAKCFVVSDKTMYQRTELPTSMFRAVEGLVAITNKVPGANIDNYTEIETLPTDSFERGQKHIRHVHISSHGFSNIKLKAKFRYNNTAALAETPFLSGGDDGLFYVGVSSVEVALVLRGLLSEEGAIEYVRARKQYIDDRGTRGPRALGRDGE